MRLKRPHLAFLVFVLSATAVGAGLAARRDYHAPAELNRLSTARPAQEPRRAQRPYPFRVLPSRLTPQLRAPFEQLGDRLHKPGNERLAVSGTLTREGAARPVRAVYEFPHLLEIADAGSPLVSFDEREARRGGPPVAADAEMLVEALFYDSAEHFFFAQARGEATRFLGSRARPEGAAEDYPGPFYDVYEVTEDVALGAAPARRTKRYFFNSDTQLLEAVRYEVERDGVNVPVEVRVGGWRRVQGQQVATAVTRLEGGRSIFSFNTHAAALLPRGATPGGAAWPDAF